MDWRDRVARWWARDVLDIPAEAIRSGGQFATDTIDYVGVLAGVGPRPLIYAPTSVASALHNLPLGNATDTVRAALDALADHAPVLQGPTWYGYATADSLLHKTTARPLTVDDLTRLDELHRQTPGDEVDESGTDGLPAFGVFAGDKLLAVACLKIWHQMPTIGVLTRPSERGRGLACDAVSAALHAGLEQRSEVQYRAFHQNRASVAVARACGFMHFGDNYLIHISPD